MISISRFALRSLFGLLAFAPSGRLRADDVPAPVRLRIGAIYGLTGPIADFGEAVKNGTVLAAETLPATTGVKLEPIFEDMKWDVKTALTAYQKLTTDPEVKIVFVMGSGQAMAIKAQTEKSKVILVTTAAHALLTKGTRYLVRHSNNAADDSLGLAKHIAGLKPKSVGSIYVENEWGSFSNDKFIEALAAALPGASMIAVPHAGDASDFRLEVLRIIRSAPQAVAIHSYGAAAGNIAKQLRELGFEGPIVANVGFVLTPDSMKIVKDNNIKNFSYQTLPDVSPKFREIYKARFGLEPQYWAQSTYTDLEMLSYMVKDAGTDTTAMMDAIRTAGSFTGTYETVEVGKTGEINMPTRVVPLD